MIDSQSIRKYMILLISALFLLPAVADDKRTQRVQFDAGTTGTVIEDSITGYEYVDFLVGAKAGQTMSVELTADNTANYFNVIPPNEEDVAVFIGSTSGGEFSSSLDLDGDWKVRVYMMRSAARRDEVANFSLSISVM